MYLTWFSAEKIYNEVNEINNQDQGETKRANKERGEKRRGVKDDLILS